MHRGLIHYNIYIFILIIHACMYIHTYIHTYTYIHACIIHSSYKCAYNFSNQYIFYNIILVTEYLLSICHSVIVMVHVLYHCISIIIYNGVGPTYSFIFT